MREMITWYVPTGMPRSRKLPCMSVMVPPIFCRTTLQKVNASPVLASLTWPMTVPVGAAPTGAETARQTAVHSNAAIEEERKTRTSGGHAGRWENGFHWKEPL